MRVLMLLALICCTEMGAMGQVNTDGRDTREAERLWASMIEAKGGRDRLLAVDSLLISANSTVRSSPFRRYSNHRIEVYVLPDRLWRWDDNRPTLLGLQIDMHDYSTGMKYHVASGADDNPSSAVPFDVSERKAIGTKLLGLIGYLPETRWWRPVPIHVISAPKGFKNAYIIQTEIDGVRLDFVIDAKSHLPLYTGFFGDDGRIDSRRNTTLTYAFRDYVEVGGLMMPKLFNFVGEGTEHLNFEINPHYDPNIFLKPTLADLGPDVWRLRK